MVFDLQYRLDETIDKIKEEAIDEYNSFYNMNIDKSTIKLYIFKDRQTLDEIKGKKTENRMIANAKGTHIYLYDLDKVEEISKGYHKKDISRYHETIRHEIAHSFYWLYLNGNYFRANRLNEGMAIYLSGQIKRKNKPVEFKNFLNFRDNEGEQVYIESGFIIEFLINNYDKEKILELIRYLGKIKSKEEFFETFKDIYGFELTYENINKLI
ncbi:hypothetical protein K9M48_03265 [Candidatus Gracilibacteria bacterium]|nr:hypothetical protein [Candidatus Gracilibacteria bacterium]